MAMNISSTPSISPALDAQAATENIKTSVQVGLLKKTLEMQQSQAQELIKMMEGKGQVIDIRA